MQINIRRRFRPIHLITRDCKIKVLCQPDFHKALINHILRRARAHSQNFPVTFQLLHRTRNIRKYDRLKIHRMIHKVLIIRPFHILIGHFMVQQIIKIMINPIHILADHAIQTTVPPRIAKRPQNLQISLHIGTLTIKENAIHVKQNRPDHMSHYSTMPPPENS